MVEDVYNARWLKQVNALDDMFNMRWLKAIAAEPPWVKQMNALNGMLNPRWLKALTAEPSWVKQMNALDGVLNPRWLNALTAEPVWVKQIAALGNTFNPTLLRHMTAVDRMVTQSSLVQSMAGVGATPFRAWNGASDASLRGLGSNTLAAHAGWATPIRALTGSVRLAASISPKASPSSIIDALTRVGASLLGQTTFALGQTSASRFQLSTEALSTLTTLELADEERGALSQPHAPLVAALIEVREAVSRSQDDVAKLKQQLREAVEHLLALRNSVDRRPLDIDRVATFVSLLVTVYFGVVQSNYARLGEERAQRQEIANARKDSQPEADPHVLPNPQQRVDPQRGLPNIGGSESELTCSAERIVLRPVRVKSARRPRSGTVAILRPGSLVTIVELSGKTAKVEYVDHVRDIKLTGWVAKKYLGRASR